MAFNADRELHDHSPVDAGSYGHAPPADSASELRGYLALLWRRKWIILPFLILTPLVAHFATGHGTTKYEATTQVLFNRQSANVSGIGDPLIFDPARTIRTQADIARLPVIASRVLKAAKLRWGSGAHLGELSVVSNDEVDLLTFHVRDEKPDLAALLANLYAEKYIQYRRQLDTTALADALRTVNPQLAALRRQGLENSGGYAALVDRQQQLQTAISLQKSNALLVLRATGAGPVASNSRRTDLLAFAAGIIIALGLAFLVDTFDTRVRSSEELADELGLLLLGGLRAPRRPGLVMLEAPNSAGAEMFRILRSTIDVTPFLNEGHALMVTSAFEGEGKSTTAANLAVAMARAGRHVILVDLDLRRPSLEKLFNLSTGSGVTDVVTGEAKLDDALIKIPLVSRARTSVRIAETMIARSRRGNSAPDNGAGAGGVLEVIGAGKFATSTNDLVVRPVLDEVLKRLRTRADLIVVDGPPLLLSADALTLSAKVDTLLLVARANTLRREYVGRLKRALAVTPALKLGLVVVGEGPLGLRTYYRPASMREAGRQPVR
jgi:Mrp family chromosome partitioning ATPase/capsular polysaccharide biosynthesis protein